jgi:predicted Zn-dependent protease
VRFPVRISVWLTVALAVPITTGTIAGRLGTLIGIGATILGSLWLWFWLPRSAHTAFEAGRYTAASRRYHLLHSLATSATRERAALLSRIGCHVASNELDAAARLFATIDTSKLDVSERAVMLNNRACALLATDPRAALAIVDEATALRPDVPALQHTRGMALLAVGRIDDAIHVLDALRGAGELAPRLEADRCRDLASAWANKGETAYADDYRLRAEALNR